MIFDDYSYLVQGDLMPSIQIHPVESDEKPGLGKGRIILLNFFIIDCKHCKRMLEYLQEELWPDFDQQRKMMYAIGRGHTRKELKEFMDQGNYLLPLAEDPDRSIFDRFAERKVPRNYLFDQDGKLIYQTRGFDLDQLATMTSMLCHLQET